MMAKLRPLDDRIIVKRVKAREMTAGGIVLPDAAQEKPREGKIISLGEGRLLDSGERAKFQVKKNDLVLFSSYAGTEVKIDGEELLVLSEDEVLAILA